MFQPKYIIWLYHYQALIAILFQNQTSNLNQFYQYEDL
nr:MAG TPA: hypothetical protein [Caudoviricetes sp.]